MAMQKDGKGQKAIQGGKWSKTPQPVVSKPGCTIVEAAQAVVKNTGGGSKQSKVMKDRPGSGS